MNPSQQMTPVVARVSSSWPATIGLNSTTSSSAGIIVRFVRGLRAAWVSGGEWERAKLVQSVYDKVIVRDRVVVEVGLTDDANRHGLVWALPEEVRVALARPAGAKRKQTTIVRVPIHGRAEWLAATRKRAAS